MKCSKCGEMMVGETVWMKGTFFGAFVPAYHCENKKCSEYKSESDMEKIRAKVKENNRK